MRKQIVIDLCKLGYCGWFALTALLIFASYDSYLSTPYLVEDNTHEACPTNSWASENSYCNAKNEVIIDSWCSKGLFVKTAYCLSSSSNEDFYLFHSDLGQFWIPLLVANSINGVGLFITLNRKYKTFGFKTCSGDILNERQNPNEVKHE